MGGAGIERYAGRFWATPQTRSYMRALWGLAASLWRVGRPDEAIGCYQRMLHLNRDDNQGVRYLLMVYLMQQQRYDQVEVLYKRYVGDPMAAWAYTRAWLDFRAGGDCPAARDGLKRAVKVNALVPAYLTGKKKIPNELPGLYGIGNENEAVLYARDYLGVWNGCEGAVRWLADRTKSRQWSAGSHDPNL